jgi:hypothetical protein
MTARMATMKRGRRLGVVGAAFALTTTALASGATVASASPADSALADALFRDGKALEAKGANVAACPKFVESYRLDPKVGTLLNMAACHEKIGKVGTAWGEFNEAAAEARAQKTVARETYAKKHAAALEAKLSKVTFVTVDPADRDLTLQLDGKDLGSAPLGTPLPLDPGPHELVAHADGRDPYSTRVTVPVGPATQTVTIPHLEKTKVVAPVVALGTGPGVVSGQTTTSMTRAGTPSTDEAARPGSWHKPVGITSLVVGGVAIAVAGTFGGLALSKHNDGNDLCNAQDQCTGDGKTKQDSARTFAAVSTATAVVGGVGVALGVIFLVTTPHADSASASSGSSPGQMWFRPSVARGGGTAEWGVSF